MSMDLRTELPCIDLDRNLLLMLIFFCISKQHSALLVGPWSCKTDKWLAIHKKGLSDICVKCRLGSAYAIRAG